MGWPTGELAQTLNVLLGSTANFFAPWLILGMTEVLWMVLTKRKAAATAATRTNEATETKPEVSAENTDTIFGIPAASFLEGLAQAASGVPAQPDAPKSVAPVTIPDPEPIERVEEPLKQLAPAFAEGEF